MTFDERLDIAGQLATRARIFYEVWWIYEGAPTKSTYREAMNQYSEFFRFDSHAHFVSLLMHLSQLFELRAHTLSLWNVLADAERASLVGAPAATAARGLLQSSKPLATKVTILRSNLFAHRSSGISYADAFKRAAITADDLRDLTGIALEVVNVLRRAMGKDERSFSPLPAEDTIDLLETLKSTTKVVPSKELHRAPRLVVRPRHR